MKKSIIFLLLIWFGTTSVYAQSKIWKIDPDYSKLQFAIDHLGISTIIGQFNEFGGTLTYSKEYFSDAKLTITVEAESISTNNARWDKQLRTEELFYKGRYPIIYFMSSTFKKQAENIYEISGYLSLRGITRKVMFKGKYGGSVLDPSDNSSRSGWELSAVINRFDFGLGKNWKQTLDNGSLIFGEEIRLLANLEFIEQR